MPGQGAILMRRFSSLCIASVALSAIVFVSPAHAQGPGSAPSSLANNDAAEKAENAALREQLLKLEEQQKTLLEQVDRLQQRLDGITTAGVQPSGPSQVAGAGKQLTSDATTPTPATNAGNASAQ